MCARAARARGEAGLLAPGAHLLIRVNARSIGQVSKLFVIEAGYELITLIRDARNVKCGLLLKPPPALGEGGGGVTQWEAYTAFDPAKAGTPETGELQALCVSVSQAKWKDGKEGIASAAALKKEVERALGRALSLGEKQALRAWFKAGK